METSVTRASALHSSRTDPPASNRPELNSLRHGPMIIVMQICRGACGVWFLRGYHGTMPNGRHRARVVVSHLTVMLYQSAR